MIVVTAPTSNIGHRVVERLLAGSYPVRVIVRDPNRLAPVVRDRIEVVEGSHGDSGTVARALKRAQTQYSGWYHPIRRPKASMLSTSTLPVPQSRCSNHRGLGELLGSVRSGAAHRKPRMPAS